VKNYEEWAFAIRISSRALKKWGFVEGAIAKPNDGSSELEDWGTIQSMLISWIMNTIEPSIRSTVTYTKTTEELWVDLKERFSIINGLRIQQLKVKFVNCK